MPRRQLVRVSDELTEVPPLAAAPAPAVPKGPNCSRAAGCYSNRQLETMLGIALAWGQGLADNLDEIRRVMSEALAQPEGESQ